MSNLDIDNDFQVMEVHKPSRLVLLTGKGVRGWWYADVFLGWIPLIKLSLFLQALMLLGVWLR